MAAFAKLPVGVSRKIGLRGVDGDDFDPSFVQQQIEFASTGFAHTRLDHDRRFNEVRGGQQTDRIGFNRQPERRRLGLIQQERQQCRGVEHHQRGTPRSS